MPASSSFPYLSIRDAHRRWTRWEKDSVVGTECLGGASRAGARVSGSTTHSLAALSPAE